MTAGDKATRRRSVRPDIIGGCDELECGIPAMPVGGSPDAPPALAPAQATILVLVLVVPAPVVLLPAGAQSHAWLEEADVAMYDGKPAGGADAVARCLVPAAPSPP